MIKIPATTSVSLLMALMVMVSCEGDDPEPVVEQIDLQDEILGNWEYELGELYLQGNSWPSLTIRPTDDCKLPGDPHAALIRPLDIRILTDHRYITLIHTQCLEKNKQYTHESWWVDKKLTLVDSVIQSSGNSMSTFTWKVHAVTGKRLELWRIAPDEAAADGVEGARMLYKFKKNTL